MLQEKQRHKGVCTGVLVTSSYLSVVAVSGVRLEIKTSPSEEKGEGQFASFSRAGASVRRWY